MTAAAIFDVDTHPRREEISADVCAWLTANGISTSCTRAEIHPDGDGLIKALVLNPTGEFVWISVPMTAPLPPTLAAELTVR